MGYLFGVVFALISVVTWWVGGNTILAGTLTGGATLIVVGLLFMFAAVLTLPLSRRELHRRFDTDLSGSMAAVVSGSAVALAVFLLVVALVGLLVSW